MEIKVLLCNCKGLCDSFKDSDMNKLPFEVESDLDVKYTVLSPQLCGQGGNAILEEAMKTAKPGQLPARRSLRSEGPGKALQETHSRDRLQ
jgi:hypothetical protein